MGEMSDYYLEASIEEEAHDAQRLPETHRWLVRPDRSGGPEPGHWTTREGRTVKISDMEDGHLLNSLRMLRRKGAIGPETLLAYLGPGPTGDMASMAFDAEHQEVLAAPCHPVVDELRAEVKRRGLKELDP